MKLTYKVLWIDDRQKQVSNAQDRVREKLARLGFELCLTKIDKVDSEKQLRDILIKNEFDLLVVDYKMQAKAKDGSELIKIIRRSCTATDIAFYSSETPSDLRSKINVDGVYCYNRNHLPSDLMYLIDARLKKLLDLNQMRGLYLAAVADFDHLIDDIIHSTFDKVDEALKAPHVKYIIDTVLKFHKSKVEQIEQLKDDMHIDKYTKLLSSNPKMSLLINILSELDEEQLYGHLGSLANYTKEIIEPRNKLAHAMEIEYKQGKYTLQSSTKEFEFNLDDFLTLRHRVLNYKDTFKNIKLLTA
jgi:CheY-like chemotaxis protein